MIAEDYVSFEIAKLLKDKGFPQEYDIYHSMVYNEEDYEDEYEVQRMVLETRLIKAGTLSSYPIGVPEPKCYCPTLQMAMKWLREEHEIDIIPIIRHSLKYAQESPFRDYACRVYDCDGNIVLSATKWYSRYENAVETAIKYCLENLI